MFFDSHTHYDDKRYDGDRDELLSGLRDEGVDFCVNAGSDLASLTKNILIAEGFDFIYAAAGIHPHYADAMTEEILEKIKKSCAHKRVVAVGETGLDFFYKNSAKDAQRHWFKRQLDLAVELNLPAIIHSRDATEECLSIIKGYAKKNLRGVIHCYSGGSEIAEEYVKLGFFIGVGGIITFPKVRQLIAAVEKIPLKNILIETDCPYLSPAPFRGERNDSGKLKFIARKIAELKKISVEETAEITKENAVGLFIG